MKYFDSEINEYYEAWLAHKNQLEMPIILSSDSNESGPYWTMQRALDVHTAGKQTATAFRFAAAVSAVDGPLPFADAIAYTGASLYSMAWWHRALA